MIDLLELARGPVLKISIVIFVLGMCWRLVGILFMPRIIVPSVARAKHKSYILAASTEAIKDMDIDLGKKFRSRMGFAIINSLVFHIGIILIVLLFAPHIMFFKRLLGIGWSWPNLPSNIITLIAAITLGALIIALIRRLSDPVLRLISNTDDYITWFVVTAPIATGLAASMHFWLPYELLISLHLLSISLLLVWFPFGKLIHPFLMFITTGQTGIQRARRGIKM